MNPNCFRLTSAIKRLWLKCHKFLVKMAKKSKRINKSRKSRKLMLYC